MLYHRHSRLLLDDASKKIGLGAFRAEILAPVGRRVVTSWQVA